MLFDKIQRQEFVVELLKMIPPKHFKNAIMTVEAGVFLRGYL